MASGVENPESCEPQAFVQGREILQLNSLPPLHGIAPHDCCSFSKGSCLGAITPLPLGITPTKSHQVTLLDSQVKDLPFCLSRNCYSIMQSSLRLLIAKSTTNCLKELWLSWNLQEPEQLNLIFLQLSQVISGVCKMAGAAIRLVQLAVGLIAIFLKAIEVTTESQQLLIRESNGSISQHHCQFRGE